MKKWLVYVLGVVTGIALSIVFVFILYLATNRTGSINEPANSNGITYFEELGDIIETRSVKVFQVIADDAALIRCADKDGDYFGPICLIVNDEGKYYYDEQKIEISKGKVARQVGIYRYPSKDDRLRTVPIITIMDK